jgi:glycosyltransferase involved in cell wall biosynthesis
MMRVTFFTRVFANVSGGHNTWLCRFLPILRQRGIDARVLCFESTPGLPTARSLRQAGFNCATVSEREIKYTKQRVRWIFDRLAEDPPDVFVVNAVYPAAYYAGRWLREAGIPTVGICHGMLSFYQGLLDEFVLARTAYQVSALVCVSNWLQHDVLKQLRNGVLVRNIPCGIPISQTVVKKPNGRLRLAYLGRLTEEYKRISELTRGLCRAVREVPGTEAVIYGDGPARPAVEQILGEDGNGSPVQLVGFVENDEIPKHLVECHAVVLLSEREGLGISLLEGMACGAVPIALRGAPGVTEFVFDGETGLLVDDRGDAFVAAVRRLRQDPGLWERLARAAHAKVTANYSEQICADRWQALLHEIGADYSAFGRRPLQIPRRLYLPPVHPALAWLDPRPPHQELLQRARRVCARWLRTVVAIIARPRGR